MSITDKVGLWSCVAAAIFWAAMENWFGVGSCTGMLVGYFLGWSGHRQLSEDAL